MAKNRKFPQTVVKPCLVVTSCVTKVNEADVTRFPCQDKITAMQQC